MKKIDLKVSEFTLEIVWNPKTTCNPETWDWNDFLHMGPYESVRVVSEGTGSIDIQEDLFEPEE